MKDLSVNFNLTAKQRQIYEYLRDYISKNDRSPYIREIQEVCRFSSHKAVIDKLLALERKGLIKRRFNKHRGIVIKYKGQL